MKYDEAEFTRLWLEGVSGPIIARKLAITEHVVYDYARKLGLPGRARKSRHPRHTNRAEKFTAMWLDKSLPLGQVCREFEANRKTVTRWATSMGLPAVRKLEVAMTMPKACFHEHMVYLPSEETIYATAKKLREKWPAHRRPLDMVPGGKLA